MTDLRKAAEEAAKVLANALSIDFNDKRDWYSYKHDVEYVANLLRQALAQDEQKPFGYVIGMGNDKYSFSTKPPEGGVFGMLTRVYTAPPKQWVGLTDEEVWEAYEKGMYEEMWFARAVEAKLKEKNA